MLGRTAIPLDSLTVLHSRLEPQAERGGSPCFIIKHQESVVVLVSRCGAAPKNSRTSSLSAASLAFSNPGACPRRAVRRPRPAKDHIDPRRILALRFPLLPYFFPSSPAKPKPNVQHQPYPTNIIRPCWSSTTTAGPVSLIAFWESS